ncbi:MAG: isoaspartyl peptidase/L-asparaginase family protein [Pyrinomonadaceae bacterium]
MSKIALAIHGGAGTILRSQMTPALEAEYRRGLESCLHVGWRVLQHAGSALDAVEAAVISLEDFPLFNAGRGSVFTHEGKNEMDASIMDGSTLDAGAVAFVKNVKNPIRLARLVMEKTGHVLLGGAGANQFALEMGVELADDAYFFTEHRYMQLLRAREEGVVELDHTIGEASIVDQTDIVTGSETERQVRTGKPLGTVGAVACDKAGRLAAATSTGGMTNKKYGRVGDTPLIGSGTYADGTCAVSGTGHGEYFMRGVTAFDVAARMKYKALSLEEAARETVEYLKSIGGEGGLIAVDAQGHVTLLFNSEGMYRGYMSDAGVPRTEIYR